MSDFYDDAPELESDEAPREEQPNPVARFVQNQAQEVFKRAGVTIDQSDPEYSALNFTNPDPAVFLQSCKVAAAAKKARLAEQKPAAGARAPASTSGSGSSKAALEKAYNEEVSAARRTNQGTDAIIKIRQKYRRQGLTGL